MRTLIDDLEAAGELIRVDTGCVVAFQPSDKAYAELARIKVADTATYAHLVVEGNRIFVKDQDSLTIWAVE